MKYEKNFKQDSRHSGGKAQAKREGLQSRGKSHRSPPFSVPVPGPAILFIVICLCTELHPDPLGGGTRTGNGDLSLGSAFLGKKRAGEAGRIQEGEASPTGFVWKDADAGELDVIRHDDATLCYVGRAGLVF